MSKNVFFQVSISGRNDGTLEAVYIYLSDKKIAKTVELLDRRLVVDYDRDGKVVGIELLEAVPIKKLTNLVSQDMRRPFGEFVKRSVPPGFVHAN